MAAVFILGIGVFNFLKFNNIYLVCAEPSSGRLLFNGFIPDGSSDGCFTMHGLAGTHRIEVDFPDRGVTREVLVYPSLGAADSTMVEITPTKVFVHGFLKHKIVR